MPPVVSVCLPVFNGERYLQSAVESVLAQTLSDFELIIIDDASLDDSFGIIKELAARDKRIIYSRNEENIGLFQNYNLCMSKAQAAIIKPFAQDDILYPTMLEKMAHVMRADKSLSLVSARRRWLDEYCNNITEKAGITSANAYLPGDTTVPGEAVIRTVLSSLDNFIGEPSTVAFRQTFVKEGFDANFRQLGDLEYWLRLLKDGNFYFISELLCDFRSHPQSASAANSKNLFHTIDFFRIGRLYREEIKTSGSSEKVFLEAVVSSVVRNLITKGDHEELYLALKRQLEEWELIDGENHRDQEYRLFKQLALHAHGRATSNRENFLQSQERIRFLERRLRELLRSPSWHSTRWLRETRRFLLVRVLKGVEQKAAPWHNLTSYESYLKREIRLVRRSRSWRASRILRAMELSLTL